MGDSDDTPRGGVKGPPPPGIPTKIARVQTAPVVVDDPRDTYVAKHPGTSPFGVPALAPPMPPSPNDVVEVIASRVDTRTKEVAQRPGPTPTQGAIHAALTLQSIQLGIQQLDGSLKAHVDKRVEEMRKHIESSILEEWKKDRDIVRTQQTQDINARSAWGKLVRDGVWKILAGGAVLFAILREWLAHSTK